MKFDDVEEYERERIERQANQNNHVNSNNGTSEKYLNQKSLDSYYSNLTTEEVLSLVSRKLTGSILWMTLGLVITGLVGAFMIFSDSSFSQMLFKMVPALMIGEIILVFIFSAMIYKLSVHMLRMIFISYSILNGITLSVIGLMYTGESIIYVFLGTITLFTVLAIYGVVTKRDLSNLKNILLVGLITLIVMSLISIFIPNGMFYIIQSFLGVAIFLVFVAYDINRIKSNLTYHIISEGAVDVLNRIEICGALSLYLDFINLFIYLLRLFGRRR